MPVTMRDVAQRAGVSPVVVSHVLHNKAKSIRVSVATAERVRQAADEL
jgi:LacI family transcriptional regulator